MFCVASSFSKVVALAFKSAISELIKPAIFTMLDIVLSGNIGSDSLTPVIGLSTIPVLLTTEVDSSKNKSPPSFTPVIGLSTIPVLFTTLVASLSKNRSPPSFTPTIGLSTIPVLVATLVDSLSKNKSDSLTPRYCSLVLFLYLLPPLFNLLLANLTR